MAWKNRDHMTAGWKAASTSKRTPAHLIPHINQRLASKPQVAQSKGMNTPAYKSPSLKPADSPPASGMFFRNPFRRSY